MQNIFNDLDSITRKRVIFIDTCSCIETGKGFGEFIIRIMPFLKKNNVKLHVAYKCFQELGKISGSSSYEQYKRDAAVEAIKVFGAMQSKDLLDVRGKESDSFADSVLLQNLLRYITKYDLMLITQDRKLATDADRLNKLLSVKSKHTIKIAKLNNKGELVAIPLIKD